MGQGASVWWKLPAELAGRADLPSTCKLVYAFLLDAARRGVARSPGIGAIGQAVGVGKATVESSLKRLQDAGLLVITRRGRGRCRIYRLLGPTLGTTPVIGVVTTPGPGVGPTPMAGVGSTPGAGVETTPGAGVALPKTDPQNGEDRRGGLFPGALAFRSGMRKGLGTRVSDAQLWQVNRAFGVGVPVRFAVAQARDLWHSVPPWTFCERLIAGWGEVEDALRLARRHHVEGERWAVPPRLGELVKAFASPEQLAWARGETNGPDPPRHPGVA